MHSPDDKEFFSRVLARFSLPATPAVSKGISEIIDFAAIGRRYAHFEELSGEFEPAEVAARLNDTLLSCSRATLFAVHLPFTEMDSLKAAVVGIEEVRCDVHADFIEHLADAERLDEGRFWKQRHAQEKVVRPG